MLCFSVRATDLMYKTVPHCFIVMTAVSPLQQADQEALRTLKDTIATISSRLAQLGECCCTIYN